MQALGLVETFEHPTLGTMRQVGNPVTMDGLRDGTVRLPPPLLGQHTSEVLAEFGYPASQVEEWIRNRVVMQGGPL